jgi:hypothetical protein
MSRLGVGLGGDSMGRHQRQREEQIAMEQGATKQIGIPLFRSSVLSLSDASAVGTPEPRALLNQDICVLEKELRT